MSQDTFQEDRQGFPRGAFGLGLRDEQESAGEEEESELLLAIIVCAKAQRPERAAIVEDQKQALQGCSKLGWEVARERQSWEGNGT